MKKNILTLSLLTLMTVFGYSQCDHLQYADDCKKHLNEDHFTFVKEFEIFSEKGEAVEHSFSLVKSQDYEYWFSGDDWSHHTMTATLYDSKHKKIASNHPSEKEFLHVIKYHPLESGIYYIKFEFHENEAFCGSAVLGFHRHTEKSTK